MPTPSPVNNAENSSSPPCPISAFAELRVLGVVTVLWWVLPGPCFGACGAAANSMRMAALSTTSEPAKLEEGEEPLVLRLHPQARGRSSWTTGIPVRDASLLREELVRPQRTTKGRRAPTPCHPHHRPHRGSCGKTWVVPQNSPAEARTCGNQGFATCVCCCRRRGTRGVSNRRWDSRCGCGHSARRCGGARRWTARSGWPKCNLSEWAVHD
jgi:hypothetical protein